MPARSQRLYPFSVWPLGYRAFLEPVLKGNPILDAMDQVEITDVLNMTEILHALTIGGPQRQNHLERQSQYLDAVVQLPTLGQLVTDCCV
jgi:hypothetical protein